MSKPTYYERRKMALVAAGKPVREVTLVCAKNGSSSQHLVERDGNSVEKQQLLAQLMKRDDETGLPLYYSETREQPFAGPLGMVPVPFVDDLNPSLLAIVRGSSTQAEERAREMSLNKLTSLKAAVAAEEVKAGVADAVNDTNNAMRGASLKPAPEAPAPRGRAKPVDDAKGEA